MKFLIFSILFLGAQSFAETTSPRNQDRIDELEKSVKVLQEKVNKMESTLMKGGGFMIVANYTCTIDAPFNGPFSATELSEKTARDSVIAQCREKNKDNGQCDPGRVKCGK